MDGEALTRDAEAQKMLPMLMHRLDTRVLARLAGKPGLTLETRPEVTFTITPPAAGR